MIAHVPYLCGTVFSLHVCVLVCLVCMCVISLFILLSSILNSFYFFEIELCICVKHLVLSLLQIVVFVYDITNHSSFENLEDWLAIVKRVFTKDGRKLPHFALVGNKSKE